MFGMFGNDDDDDFSPSPSSKLSSLFNSSGTPDDLNSNSLIYKAPRQPKAKPETDHVDNSKDNRTPSSVILAKVITLWTIESNKQKHLGKHIIAIIGCPLKNVFEAIIYKEKNNILLRRLLNETCQWHKYPNNFVSFYHNDNQFWTLSFDHTHDRDGFLGEVSKHNCPVVDKSTTVPSEPSQPQLVGNNGNSDSELSKTKADILSRITKMGQQILPESALQQTTGTEYSDSETEDLPIKKPVTTPRKSKRSSHQEKLDVAQIVTPGSQIAFSHPQGGAYPHPYADFGYVGYLAAQNADLKTNLAEINYKLNRVLNNGKDCGDEDVAKLKSEIKILKLKIENVNSELEGCEKKCNTLREEYDRKCEEVRDLGDRLKWDKDEKKSEAEHLERELEIAKREIENRDEVVREQNLKLEELEGISREHRRCRDEIQSLNDQILELRSDTKEKSDNQEVGKVIRKSMNEAFAGIMENFREDISYSSEAIRLVVLQQLKKTTFDIVAGLK
ncbi:uncharacterized protein LOC132702177 [Cylas formicarius]|uniref:uncharacterized protein LOC132702177 n=1 Tax=Cylas formicarius TaxID=197179 RepID=UPI002958463C|nr:uncharacterized protein LOC132702177 [Cylas formicarius]